MAFFIVYSPEGETPPKYHHDSHGAALSEAHRMAKRCPGKQFYVMRSASKPIIEAAEALAEEQAV